MQPWAIVSLHQNGCCCVCGLCLPPALGLPGTRAVQRAGCNQIVFCGCCGVLNAVACRMPWLPLWLCWHTRVFGVRQLLQLAAAVQISIPHSRLCGWALLSCAGQLWVSPAWHGSCIKPNTKHRMRRMCAVVSWSCTIVGVSACTWCCVMPCLLCSNVARRLAHPVAASEASADGVRLW